MESTRSRWKSMLDAVCVCVLFRNDVAIASDQIYVVNAHSD